MEVDKVYIPIVDIPLEEGVKLSVKREDLVHLQISGNKYWKMFYNVKTYLAREVKNPLIITFGERILIISRRHLQLEKNTILKLWALFVERSWRITGRETSRWKMHTGEEWIFCSLPERHTEIRKKLPKICRRNFPKPLLSLKAGLMN